MTADKKFKGKIRARMKKTGERYAAARAALAPPRSPAFRDVVLKVIALGDAANREYDNQSKNRKGAAVALPVALGANIAARPAKQALKEYVQSLSDDDVMKLQTLMYAGRDDDRDIPGLHEYLADNTRGRGDAIMTMTDKWPLPEYLLGGLAIADGAGVDIEGRF